MLPLKTQFPLQHSRLQSIYRSTFGTRFQEGPGSWSLSPLPLLRVGLAPGPPQTLPPGCFVIVPHARLDHSIPCPPGSFSLFRSHWSFTPLACLSGCLPRFHSPLPPTTCVSRESVPTLFGAPTASQTHEAVKVSLRVTKIAFLLFSPRRILPQISVTTAPVGFQQPKSKLEISSASSCSCETHRGHRSPPAPSSRDLGEVLHLLLGQALGTGS